MLVDIEINGKKHEREVYLEINPEILACKGSVGIAEFKWIPSQYDYPAVFLPTVEKKETIEKSRRLVKLFLLKYKELLAPRSTPLTFDSLPEEEKEKGRGKAKKGKEKKVSGVPLWMLKYHKVKVNCYGPIMGHYQRRAKFKEESKELVNEYLPFCCKCQAREHCPKQCGNKEVNSSIQVL